MTLTEIGDKFTGHAHQGHAESKVVIQDENGNWKEITDVILAEDDSGRTHIVIKHE